MLGVIPVEATPLVGGWSTGHTQGAAEGVGSSQPREESALGGPHWLGPDCTGTFCSFFPFPPSGLSACAERVPASEKFAEKDLKNMEKYKAKIMKVSNSEYVDPAVIASIILMVISLNFFFFSWCIDIPFFQADKWHKTVGTRDSEEHIRQGTRILCWMIKIQNKFPTWKKEQQLKAMAFNVQSYKGMDIGTTHSEYANDARAKIFKRNGY
uniref:Lysozyme g n=1 Tax=Anser brachyrhynchus TaxID=132585 RepID=A0A8B9BYF8_9AVES